MILSAEIIVGMLATGLLWLIPAFLWPRGLSSLILSGLTSNPFKTPITVTMMDTNSAMTMMDKGPAPIQTMIIGPRATLGKLFNTTR